MGFGCQPLQLYMTLYPVYIPENIRYTRKYQIACNWHATSNSADSNVYIMHDSEVLPSLRHKGPRREGGALVEHEHRPCARTGVAAVPLVALPDVAAVAVAARASHSLQWCATRVQDNQPLQGSDSTDHAWVGY